jgi:outer membrane protein assembly factor BamA
MLQRRGDDAGTASRNPPRLPLPDWCNFLSLKETNCPKSAGGNENGTVLTQTSLDPHDTRFIHKPLGPRGRYGRASLCTSRGAQKPAPAKIVGIRVTGNKHIATDAILAAAQLKIGETVTVEKLTEAQSRIFDMGVFGYKSATLDESVNFVTQETRESEAHIIIKVEENPQIRKIEFIQPQPLRPDQLRKILTFKPGSVYNPKIMARDAMRLEEDYAKQGYIAAVSETTMVDGVVRITLVVAKVAEIKIIGNKRTSTRIIMNLLRIKPGDYYNTEKRIEGLRRLHNADLVDQVNGSEAYKWPGRISINIYVVEKQR